MILDLWVVLLPIGRVGELEELASGGSLAFGLGFPSRLGRA